ncbi:hypothetical protein BSKO_11831 [Bryopsis sp. KO-2023]|nr:hypothetical protein BSKO_11831 [Bryopsis sp. KO-2023]
MPCRPLPLVTALVILCVTGQLSFGASGGTIRTGTVVNSLCPECRESKAGFDVFLSTFEEKFPNGLEIGGFNFTFDHKDVVSAMASTRELNDGWKQLLNETNATAEGSPQERARSLPHFLLGANKESYLLEQRVAERTERVLIHSSAYAITGSQRVKHSFSLPPQPSRGLDLLVTSFSVKGVSRIALVHQSNDHWNDVICGLIADSFRELSSFNATRLELTMDKGVDLNSVQNIVSTIVENDIEVLVGCTDELGSQILLDSFWEAKYPFKGQVFLDGPQSQAFVNRMGERAQGVLGVGMWHVSASLKNDGFFGTPVDFMKRVGREPSEWLASGAASFFVLMEAFRASFAGCDISNSEGDVDRMLFDEGAISCGSGSALGYQRFLDEIRYIKLDTIFGPVEFGKFGQNDLAHPFIMQVHGDKVKGFAPRVVLPVSAASSAFTLPWKNPFAPRQCPVGTYKGRELTKPCPPCPAGTHSSSKGSLQCSPCASNTFQPHEGAVSCFQCPDNTGTKVEGATSAEACECFPGYFHIHGWKGAACQQCPYGATCEGGTEPPIPKPGFWSDQNFRGDIQSCDNADACPGGGSDTCAEGYEGRMCQDCSWGFFHMFESCFACRSKFKIVLLLLFVFVLWWLINSVVSHRVETVELTLNWAQLVNIIGSVQLNWPAPFQSLFSIASILDFDVDVVQPNCLVASGWNYWKNFAVQLLLPAFLSSMAFLWYGICVWRYRMGKQGRLGSNWLGKFIMRGVPRSGGREWVGKRMDHAIARTLAAIEVTYITITRYCFDVLHCHDYGGVQVMSASLDVECSSTQYKVLLVMAVLGLVVYTCGYLVFTAYILTRLHTRKSFSDPSALNRFGFIYERFELGYAWTSVMMLVIRIMFVMSVVLSDNPLSAAAAMALITVAWLLIHVYTLPYVDEGTDLLQTFLLVALMALGYAGVMFSDSQLPQATKDRFTFGGVVLFVLMAVVLVWLLSHEVLGKIRMRIIQTRHRAAVMNSLQGSVDSEFIRDDLLAGGIDVELYNSFNKDFLYHWLKNADEATLLEFDRMSVVLRDYLGDDSYLSFLSMEIVARFWRKMVKAFPEIIDFLAMADGDAHDAFTHFVDVLYRDFFVRSFVASDSFHSLVEWKDHAPIAQWLLICSEEERKRFANLMASAYKSHVHQKHGKKEAERAMTMLRRVQSGGQFNDIGQKHDSFAKQMKLVSVRYRSAYEQMIRKEGPLQHQTSNFKRQRTLVRLTNFHDSRSSTISSICTNSRLESIDEVDEEEGLSDRSSSATSCDSSR